MSNFSFTKNDVLDNTQFWRENSEQGYCEMVQQIIESRPFGKHPFYIYQFVKRVDDATGIKKMYHHPRLTKPDPIPGTTLLRADPSNPEEVTIIWTLPDEESFNLYQSGKMFADPFVYESIQKYLHNPRELMRREKGDLTDEEIKEIYQEKVRGVKNAAPTKKRNQI